MTQRRSPRNISDRWMQERYGVSVRLDLSRCYAPRGSLWLSLEPSYWLRASTPVYTLHACFTASKLKRKKETALSTKGGVFKRPPQTLSRGQSEIVSCFQADSSPCPPLQPSRDTFTRVMGSNRISHLPLFHRRRRVVPIPRHARTSFAPRLERAAAMLTRIRVHL